MSVQPRINLPSSDTSHAQQWLGLSLTPGIGASRGRKLVEHFDGWGWVLVNGLVTLALGIMIWRRWPEASFWVIGLFVGIDLLFAGWSWVMTAVAVRTLAGKAVTP